MFNQQVVSIVCNLKKTPEEGFHTALGPLQGVEATPPEPSEPPPPEPSEAPSPEPLETTPPEPSEAPSPEPLEPPPPEHSEAPSPEPLETTPPEPSEPPPPEPSEAPSPEPLEPPPPEPSEAPSPEPLETTPPEPSEPPPPEPSEPTPPEPSEAPSPEPSEQTDKAVKLEQEDGQTAGPPSEDHCNLELKWDVGSQCLALWSEDGEFYPATVLTVDGEHCRVRFNGYGNEEDVDLNTLQSLSPPTPPSSQLQDWKPGSRCRALYSGDGLVYPAVVLWVKGERCRVRYDKYNNEEELDVSGLLSRDELHGPSRSAAAAKGSSRKSGSSSRKQEGETRSPRRDDQNSSLMKDKPWTHIKVEKEADERRENQQTDSTNQEAAPVPPFPPEQDNFRNTFIPLPHPSCTSCGKDAGGSADVGTITSMLMQWYMCGFHTGSYMTRQQLSSSSKDEVQSPR